MAHGDPVAREHLREQRVGARVAAQQHRDLGRLDPLAHQLEHRGADQLGLGTLAARLEQPDRAVRRPPRRRRARTASARGDAAPAARRRVVLGPLGQVDDLGGERAQLLDRRRAAGERDPARLVGQRHAHVGSGVADERLDGVALRSA